MPELPNFIDALGHEWQQGFDTCRRCALSRFTKTKDRPPCGSRFATDAEARAAGERMVKKHRKSLEKLAQR